MIFTKYIFYTFVFLISFGLLAQTPLNQSYENQIVGKISNTNSSSCPQDLFPTSWSFNDASNFIATTPFSPDNLKIIPREAWGAKRPRGNMRAMNGIKGIVIHHTAGPSNVTPNEIQNMHMKKNKWTDIGYHFVIAKDSQGNWQVYEGRKLAYKGAHGGMRGKLDMSSHQIGIVIAGNFSKASATNPTGYLPKASESEKQPEIGAVEKLGELITYLEKTYPTIDTIYSHGSGTKPINPGHSICPGEAANHIVAAFDKRFGKKEK